jgi:hypothetical protein
VNLDNPVVKLCIEGSRAEYERRPDEARALYWQAWQSASNDYEACIAAHYVARFQPGPKEILYWNQEALNRANLVDNESVREFYPSLYLNMGHSYELLDDPIEAKRFFDLAAGLGYAHHNK